MYEDLPPPDLASPLAMPSPVHPSLGTEEQMWNGWEEQDNPVQGHLPRLCVLILSWRKHGGPTGLGKGEAGSGCIGIWISWHGSGRRCRQGALLAQQMIAQGVVLDPLTWQRKMMQAASEGAEILQQMVPQLMATKRLE